MSNSSLTADSSSSAERLSPANVLVCGLIITIFGIENTDQWFGSAGRLVRLVPEYLSLICLVVVLGYIGKYKRLAVGPWHVVIFFLFVTHLVAGFVSQGVQPGSIIVGIRYYLKYIPFFLLPMAYRFSDTELFFQWRLILWIAFMQLPIVLIQRFVLYRDLGTGDVVTGSLNISSELSTFLVVTVGLLVPFMVLNRWPIWKGVFVCFWLLIPTTLNETKGTLILLPIAVGIPLWWLSWKFGRFSLFAASLIGLLFFSVIFVSFYDVGKGKAGDADFIELVVSGKIMSSLYQRDKGEKVLSEDDATNRELEIGRVDALLFPFDETKTDFVSRLLGFGAGNVSSPFHDLLAGAYVQQFEHLDPEKSTASILLWELGLIGVVLYLVGLSVLWFDCRSVRGVEGAVPRFGIGWSAVPVLLFVMLAYKNTFNWNFVGYLVMFYGGVVGAYHVRCRSRSSAPNW